MFGRESSWVTGAWYCRASPPTILAPMPVRPPTPSEGAGPTPSIWISNVRTREIDKVEGKLRLYVAEINSSIVFIIIL